MDMGRVMDMMGMDKEINIVMGIDVGVGMDMDVDMVADVSMIVDIYGNQGIIVDLAIAMVMGIRTDSFMYTDIDMPMLIRSKSPPQLSLINLNNMANLVQQLSKIASKMVQHGAKTKFRTTC